MLNIFSVTFPFFALVLCGYVAARRKLLPLEAIPGLNGFVLFFALPCMLYRFGAGTPIAQLLDASVFFVWLACALLMVALATAFTLKQKGWNDAAFGALVAAFPNTGFMGVPLLLALLGASAAGPTIITIVIDMVVTTSLCIALSRLESAGTHGMAVALRKALKGVVMNPMAWSILLGVLASSARFTLPGPLNKTVGLLADSASPVALFTIGAVLARSDILVKQNGHPKMAVGDYLPITLLKLLLHPLLVWGMGQGAIALGAPLDPFALMVMVLVAALPSASNVVVLAERFEADSGRIARIILVTTAMAFVSFALAVQLLT